jgi:murein DD-endopeptidase MepM/ murein hydrolase activator NlpD
LFERTAVATLYGPDMAARPLLLLAALAALGTGSARAAEPSLSLPVACVPGETCWIANYVDHDPGSGFRDYHCGALGYDGHDGTDFALRDEAAMKAGVAVLAAAPGTVRGVRDGMADTGLGGASKDEIADRECGNGVVIAHEEGWETQYCHMRRGSVAVKQGDQVARGQTLGLVGLSGNTEFPHLHLTVRRGRAAVDPFLGGEAFGACRIGAGTLWAPDTRAAIAYRPIAIYNAGFSGGAPDATAIRRGERAVPTTASEALVLWSDIFGIDQGDRIRLRITGPDGKVVHDHTRTIDKRAIRRFEFAGRRKPAEAWPAGTYTGEIVVKRGDAPDVRRSESVDLK